MYHVKEIPTAPPGGLDMNIADEEEFSPDKLRSNLERTYMTIVGVALYNIHLHAYGTTGYWNDYVWQTHRPPPVMARVQSYLILCISLFSSLDTRPDHAYGYDYARHSHRLPTVSPDPIPTSANCARQF